MTAGLGEIRISAPGKDKCTVCAVKHDPRDPHERDSLYYLCRFYRAHQRFPNWADAMAHCSAITKASFTEKLKKRGIDFGIQESGERHD